MEAMEGAKEVLLSSEFEARFNGAKLANVTWFPVDKLPKNDLA